MSDQTDVTDRPRLVREGHLYETDHTTQKAYTAVKAVDPYAARMLFKQWLQDGKIRPDLDAERRLGIAPLAQTTEQRERAGQVEMTAERVRELYGKEPRWAVAEGNVYVNPETNQYRALTPDERKQFRETVLEDFEDRLEAYYEDMRVEAAPADPEMLERIAQAEEDAFIREARAGEVAMSPQGVRTALNMEAREAVRQRLVTVEDVDGSPAYRVRQEQLRALEQNPRAVEPAPRQARRR